MKDPSAPSPPEPKAQYPSARRPVSFDDSTDETIKPLVPAEVERLRADNERLRVALTDLLDAQFHADRSLDQARGRARATLADLTETT